MGQEPDPASARAAIIKSLFRRDGPTDHGELVSHLRVNEEASRSGGGPADWKPRYILLAVKSDGNLWIHKSKRNSNGTFSIGKTWSLTELMTIEVASRTSFAITLNSRSYLWQTLEPTEQINFIVSIVRCFRAFTGQDLRLIACEVNEPANAPPPYTIPPLPSSQQPQPQTRPPMSSSQSSQSMRPGPSQSSAFSQSSAAQPTASSRGHARNHSQGTSSRSTPLPVPPAPPMTSTGSASSFGSGSASGHHAQPPPPPPQQQQQQQRGPLPTRPPSVQRNPSQTSVMRPASRSGQRAAEYNEMRSAPSHHVQRASLSQSFPAPDRRATPPPASQPQAPSRTESPAFSQRSRTSPQKMPPQAQRSPPKVAQPVPRQPPRLSEPDELSGRGSPFARTATPPTAPAPQRPPPIETSAPEPESRKKRSDPTTPPSAPPQGLARGLLPPEEDQTLANVEEMLEGFEWRTLASLSGAGGGASLADVAGSIQSQIEKSLVGELSALESASIHAIVESDDRVEGVLGHLNDAMAELDRLDQMITLYKTQLNVMTDDIDHIEGQNKGLQVELSNQRALVAELDQLLDTINIPRSDLEALAKESLETKSGIERLEKAAVGLYKAVLSMRDKSRGDMAAASERGGDYLRYSTQFCKRMLDFLSVMFEYQTKQVSDALGQKKAIVKLQPHQQLEEYLERYMGLMLFVKEIDDSRYQQICAAYFASMSDLYSTEITGLFNYYKSSIRKPTDEELDANFVAMSRQQQQGGAKRAPRGGKSSAGEQLSGGEALAQALAQVGPHIHREQSFVADLLHVTGLESYITFADFMELETFFRRNAANYMAENAKHFKDLRSSMDLIFGFLQEVVNDTAAFIFKQDPVSVVGVLAAIDRTLEDSAQVNNDFFDRVLHKTGELCARHLQQMINDQVKAIEQTKLTVKKRKGVVPFIRVFPLFVERVETQLFGAEALPIRNVIDERYKTLVSTMFENLQHMAKMGQQQAAANSAEDKDQLNYHIVLIENMSHFNTVVRELKVPSLAPHMKRAGDIYDENLSQYIRIVLRRPFPRLLEFFSGLEILLRTTPPSEVGMHSAYNKSAAKKAAGSVSSKELRKGIEALSKRVEKHFGDISNPSAENAAVLATVWRACMDETLRLTSSWQSLIGKCYAEKNVSLDFSLEEVEAAYKRNKPSANAT